MASIAAPRQPQAMLAAPIFSTTQTNHVPAKQSFPRVHHPRIFQASSALVARIRRGLEALSKGETRDRVSNAGVEINLLQEAHSRSSWRSLAQHESELWMQSLHTNVTEPDAGHRAWNLRILAATLHIFRKSRPEVYDDILTDIPGVSLKTRGRWQDTAKAMNQVVSGIWPSWGIKSFLIYEIVAKNQYGFRSLIRLPTTDRSRMIEAAIDTLRKDPVPALQPSWIYNAAAGVSSLTHERPVSAQDFIDSTDGDIRLEVVCEALGLPAPTYQGYSMTLNSPLIGTRPPGAPKALSKRTMTDSSNNSKDSKRNAAQWNQNHMEQSKQPQLMPRSSCSLATPAIAQCTDQSVNWPENRNTFDMDYDHWASQQSFDPEIFLGLQDFPIMDSKRFEDTDAARYEQFPDTLQ